MPIGVRQGMKAFGQPAASTHEFAVTESSPQDDAYQRALGFLYDRINYERMASGTARYSFRLHRTYELLRRLGLEDYLQEETAVGDQPPSKTKTPRVPIVHVAGTKGKGSTCTMVAAALTASGLRTGLYTSPHLHQLEERFRVDGEPCDPASFTALIDRIAPVVEELTDSDFGSPSFFELTTAIALLHFDTSACDVIVLEVGLGGRLDSTNVCAPSVTAVTSIGLDHTHVLGDTLAEIAGEKAGIIKPSVPVICGVRDGGVGKDDAAGVIKQRAESQSSPLLWLGRDFDFSVKPNPGWGSHVGFQGWEQSLLSDFAFDLSLDGAHQAHNASLAIAILSVLKGQGVDVDFDRVREAFMTIRSSGRIERFLLPQDVTVIVDAAHNLDSVIALCDCLQQRFADGPLTVVFGTSRDKSADEMLCLLAGVADTLVLTRFQGNPRYTPTAELAKLAETLPVDRVDVVENPVDACRRGIESVTPGGTMVVCGSFFLAAETRQWVAEQQTLNGKPSP